MPVRKKQKALILLPNKDSINQFLRPNRDCTLSTKEHDRNFLPEKMLAEEEGKREILLAGAWHKNYPQEFLEEWFPKDKNELTWVGDNWNIARGGYILTRTNNAQQEFVNNWITFMTNSIIKLTGQRTNVSILLDTSAKP